MLVLLIMSLLIQSNSSLTSELPLLILFPLYLILMQVLYLCLKCVNCFSSFMTFWTMLFPGSILRSGLHSSLFFTASGMWFLLVGLACMEVLTGIWCRLSKCLPWVCLNLFPLRGVARQGHRLDSISQCKRDLWEGLVVYLWLRGLTWRLGMRLIQCGKKSAGGSVSTSSIDTRRKVGCGGSALLMCCHPQPPPHHLEFQLFRLVCFSDF